MRQERPKRPERPEQRSAIPTYLHRRIIPTGLPRRILWIPLAALLILLASGGGQSVPTVSASPPDEPPGQTARGQIARGQILVKFRLGLDPKVGSRLAGADEAEPAHKIERLGVHRFRVPPGREREFVDRFARHPLVEYAEPDYQVSVALLPNDPGLTSGQQWHLAKIDAPAAWDVTTGGTSPVTIAIIDSGIDGRHPDLADRTIAGFNFLARQPIPAGTNSDGHGHGTHVAGIAGAATNNGVGVAGVSWSARLMPVRILDATGNGNYSDLSEGVVWAADHGAQVINMSVGGPVGTAEETRTITAAVDYAWQKGAFLAAAAGNAATKGNPIEYPAALDRVVAVAATDPSDQRAPFSNYHPYVDVAAPGVGIYSTIPNGGYTSGSGTSMATPIVSGIAALLLAAEPSLTPSQIAARLEQTAVDLGPPGKDIYYGAGRVSAARTLVLAINPKDLTLRPAPGASGVITITNLMTGTLTWQAQSNADWLKVSGSSQSGQLAAQSSSRIIVTTDEQLRPPNVVTGTIQISASLGDRLSLQRAVGVGIELIRSRLFVPMLGRNAVSGG